jgi:hypothetical protein
LLPEGFEKILELPPVLEGEEYLLPEGVGLL